METAHKFGELNEGAGRDVGQVVGQMGVTGLDKADVALIAAGISLVAALLTFLGRLRGEARREQSEHRLRLFERASSSVAEASASLMTSFELLTLAAAAHFQNHPRDAIMKAENALRRAHTDSYKSGALVPPVLNYPLDRAREAIASATAALHSVSSETTAQDVLTEPLAALLHFQSMATRWHRKAWRDAFGKDAPLEVDDPSKPTPTPPDWADWVSRAKKLLEEAG